MKRVPPHMLFWSAVLAVAVSVALAARDLPAHFAGESGLPPATVRAAKTEEPGFSIDPILQLSPFGRKAQDTPAAATEPETSLGLVLRGVAIAAGAPSTAIISSSSEPARTYAVGDLVSEGARLAEVEADHVVLDLDGRREILSFPDAPSESAALSVDGEAAPPADTGDLATTIAAWHDRAREDPRAVLDMLGLEPETDGYKVTENPSDELKRMGLNAGDVVTKVNGQQVGLIQPDLDLFDVVLASGHATVDVVRNGEPLVLSFPLK